MKGAAVDSVAGGGVFDRGPIQHLSDRVDGKPRELRSYSRQAGWGDYPAAAAGAGEPSAVDLVTSAVANWRSGPTWLTWISTLWRLLPASSCHVRWTSLPATTTRIPFLSVRLAFSATERHAVQRKNPSLTSCHSPLCWSGG